MADQKLTNRKPKAVAAEGYTRRKIDNPDTCFVIMPFGGYFDEYYNRVYAPAIAASGLLPIRGDKVFRPGSVMDDIWRSTKEAKIILADLSEMNPNVFYELGLAHAITKPVILIAENIEDIPFDLRNLRVIEYDKNDSNWGEKLGDKIQNSIAEITENPHLSILTTFMETTDQPSASATELEMAFIDLKQEVDSLRLELGQQRLTTTKLDLKKAQQYLERFYPDLDKDVWLKYINEDPKSKDSYEQLVTALMKAQASKRGTIPMPNKASTKKPDSE